jgi:hypothetical protein
VSGVYDSGIVPVSVASTGGTSFSDEYGVELNLGAYVYHTWKHTTLGLDYRGDFRHYEPVSYYDGTDQFLSLILTHKPSKHVEFTLRSQAGTYSWNVLQPSALGLIAGNYLQTPQNDLFYNPVIFLSTAGDLTYRKSARLSFNLGGEGDVVRRRSSALYGVISYSARGDMEYRATRHTTLGADYHYTHFDFNHMFGATNIHSVGLNYSLQLAKHTQLSVRAGGARVETSNLMQVAIDPAIAAIIGQTVGIQAAYHLNYTPDVSARLINSFQRSQFTVSYINGVTPGNGVYLTSRTQAGTASYHYTGVRYWNFAVDGNYSRLSTIAQSLGTFTTYGAGAGATRELGKGFHAVVRFDVLRYDIVSNRFLHTEYRTSVGFTFSPGDVPLALW